MYTCPLLLTINNTQANRQLGLLLDAVHLVLVADLAVIPQSGEAADSERDADYDACV
jgi:hypothetical protein